MPQLENTNEYNALSVGSTTWEPRGCVSEIPHQLIVFIVGFVGRGSGGAALGVVSDAVAGCCFWSTALMALKSLP